MPKLLQINICSNIFSTGKICENIAQKAQSKGWDTYIVYGNSNKPSTSLEYKVAGIWNKYVHYIEFRLFDNEGLASRIVTKRLVKYLKEINPDIVHLHVIHNHYLNYPILFKYLSDAKIPVVWTQHDCWAFTGGCTYFDMLECDGWKLGCLKCPDKRTLLCNQSARNFRLKKTILDSVDNIVFVPVSEWLASMLRQSCQKNREIRTIHNGTDLSIFRNTLQKDTKQFKILGVASTWAPRKGLNDFIKLRKLLPKDITITLVGLSDEQVKHLPEGIVGITRTSNLDEMVKIYSSSNVLVNPTYSDNFPTVNIEALACGTPVITYNTGGSPEAIDEKTGIVVTQGDIYALAKAIIQVRDIPFLSEDCRKRADLLFDKEKCFDQYIKLYESLLQE